MQQKYLLASIFLTLILTIYFGLIDAKGQGVIKGVITDAKTHETIVGANVILKGKLWVLRAISTETMKSKIYPKDL
jgi:hypothetical protein